MTFSLSDLKTTLMVQEKILESLAEFPSIRKRSPPRPKPEDITLNVSLCRPDESVISTRNDPDYFRLTQTKFDINKSYIELI